MQRSWHSMYAQEKALNFGSIPMNIRLPMGVRSVIKASLSGPLGRAAARPVTSRPPLPLADRKHPERWC